MNNQRFYQISISVVVLLLAPLTVKALPAQTLGPPVAMRSDSILSGSAAVTWPALYDSSRAIVTICGQVRVAGVTKSSVCRSKTGPWVRRVIAPPPPPPPPPPVATLTALLLTPSSVAVVSGGTAQFAVGAIWSDGTTVIPTLSWVAHGGTVSSAGLYTAGGITGVFPVIVSALGKADTSLVTVTSTPPPPPGELQSVPVGGLAFSSAINGLSSGGMFPSIADADSGTVGYPDALKMLALGPADSWRSAVLIGTSSALAGPIPAGSVAFKLVIASCRWLAGVATCLQDSTYAVKVP